MNEEDVLTEVDLKVLVRIRDGSGFLTHSSHAFRAEKLEAQGLIRGAEAVYKMSSGERGEWVEYRRRFTLTSKGAVALRQRNMHL